MPENPKPQKNVRNNRVRSQLNNHPPIHQDLLAQNTAQMQNANIHNLAELQPLN